MARQHMIMTVPMHFLSATVSNAGALCPASGHGFRQHAPACWVSETHPQPVLVLRSPVFRSGIACDPSLAERPQASERTLLITLAANRDRRVEEPPVFYFKPARIPIGSGSVFGPVRQSGRFGAWSR